MNVFKVILSLLSAAILSGCVSHKELVNFNEVDLPIGQVEMITNSTALLIQANDLLRIKVHSANPTAVLPYNQTPSSGEMNVGMAGPNTLQLFQGYLVDLQGNINFSGLGQIATQGLTLQELERQIQDRIRAFVKDAVVDARFLNFKVTILGEVLQPGVQSIPNTRVTILEAIGLAGDLTDYANRRRVLVVREIEGRRTYARINLQAENIFQSPFFYLQQNDLIYVEPIRARTATIADPAQRLVSYGTALLSVAALALTLSRN